MNRWTSRYQISCGQEAERFKSIERLVSSLKLSGREPEAEFGLFQSAMKNTFLCSAQDKKILLTFLALAKCHAMIHFPSESAFVKGINARSPWGNEMNPAIIFTGLAGTGKTELLRALGRLLGESSSFDVPGHGCLPLVPAWFLSLIAGPGLNEALSQWIEQPSDILNSKKIEEEKKKPVSFGRLLDLARRISFRDGVCLLPADEFQFVTTSSNANALATRVLLQLLSIGPRLLYAANYSLVHRLQARNQEDRQRLLVHRIHLMPESFCCADGVRLLAAYFDILPDDFNLDAANVGQQIQDYTYGIKRFAVLLLALAWVRAKSHRGHRAKVSTDDFRWAYLCSDYSDSRDDVVTLQRQDISRKKIKEGLWDPFYSEQEDNVVTLTPAIEAFEKRVEDKRLDSFLTPIERIGFEALKKSREPPTKGPKVVQLGRGKRSKQDLADALNMMDE